MVLAAQRDQVAGTGRAAVAVGGGVVEVAAVGPGGAVREPAAVVAQLDPGPQPLGDLVGVDGDVLGEVDLVACEDTRRTRALMLQRML